jgi:hypothetical protein
VNKKPKNSRVQAGHVSVCVCCAEQHFALRMDDWLVATTLILVGFLSYLFIDQQRHLGKISQILQDHSQILQAQSLTTHQILSQLPTNIVHIVLTPSVASETKEKSLKALLDVLAIDFPRPSETVLSSEKHFSKFNFKWQWTQNSLESSSYQPFCDAFHRFIQSSTRLELVCAAVGNGNRLADGLLFSTSLFTLRRYDMTHVKVGKVLYKGEVRGTTDIVVMDYDPIGEIARHNVKFAIEVKSDLTNESRMQSGLREACIGLLGLCGDNCNGTPPVLLTDFVSVFLVVYLDSTSHSRFQIIAQRCCNLKSAMSLAYEISQRDCISADFGRPDTPCARDED